MATGRMVNGVFVAFTTEEQAAWDASQPSAAALLAEAKAGAVQAVKRQAGARILARLPEWKQSNLQARELELTSILLGTHPTIAQRALMTEEQAERAAAVTDWEWARSVRAASDAIEADVSALADVPAVSAWIAAMPSDGRWPA